VTRTVTRRAAALALEWRVQWRYRVPAVALVVTLLWTVTLLAMPTSLARSAGPVILTLDTATFGSFFIAALFLFERGEGALAALSVSPLRFGEYLGAKVATLTGLSIGSAVPIALAAGRGPSHLGSVVLAVGLLSVLFLVLNFALVVRHRSLTGFLSVAPLPLVPLIAAPLAHLTDILDHPVLYLVPTTGATDLLRAGIDPATQLSPARTGAVLGYLVLAIAVATLAARRSFDHEFTRPGPSRPPRERRRRGEPRATSWRTALVHIDIRTTLRSPLLVVVLAGPILLAVILRLAYPPLTAALHARFGFDLTTYQPVLLAALVVLHVPMIIGMVGALVILDDVDDRTVLILRVSPVTLPRYLAHRMISIATTALIMLVITVPLSGLASWPAIPALLPALTLAAAQAPLLTLATTALATNKVEGLAWLKILGLLPTAIAPAMWWLPESAHWPLWILPHYWTVDLLDHFSPTSLLIGTALTATTGALLSRRTLRRLR
jgi:fluoroquinolone transport system permease protein